MKNTETLEKLYEIVGRQIEKCVDALEREGGKLPMEDARYLDYLTHAQKSIKTTLAMEGYGNSERRGRDSMGRFTSRDDGRSEWGYYPMRAWDDGRGSYDGNANRGGSYDGHSNRGDPREELRRMADQTDDERVKRALHTAMQQM